MKSTPQISKKANSISISTKHIHRQRSMKTSHAATWLRQNTPARLARGFTIVELLIVIVVIGILAAITIVAYNGIQDRATKTVLKSDLSAASKQLAMDKTLNDNYPSTVNPDGSGDANDGSGLSASKGTTYEYTTDGSSYCLSAVNGNQGYHITNDSSPEEGVCSGHSGPVAGGGGDSGGDGSTLDGITIGSQTWASTNLNVGTRVDVSEEQSDNSILEKYCPEDKKAYCDTYGALYQWGEAMQYSTTAGAQGICPTGWHIPSHNDWKILEMELGMTETQADADNWRGTDQGTQLKDGGSSGLDIPLAGDRLTSGSSAYRDAYANLWSSTMAGSGSHAQKRGLYSGDDRVYRDTLDQRVGGSVRCLEN